MERPQLVSCTNRQKESVPLYASYALCMSIDNALALTWCACLFTWDVLRNDSAVPAVSISACVRACVHPLPSRKSQNVVKAAIYMCKPHRRMTHFSSPHTSGQFHWISLAIVNSGWSSVKTGTLSDESSDRHRLGIIWEQWQQ